jgi:DNA-directed RNA polymerase specialized sigma24 family protein
MDDATTRPGSTRKGDGAYLVGDWQRDLREDEGAAWERLTGYLVEGLRLGLRGSIEPEPEDAAQSLILRWLSDPERTYMEWPPEVRLRSWAMGIARTAAAGWRRRSLRTASGAIPERPPRRQPLSLQEIVIQLAELASTLSPPHNWILWWRFEGRTRAEIAESLAKWRGVGPSEARRLVRTTMGAVREAIEGRGGSKGPRKKNSKQNPWKTSPPPN